MAPYGTTISSRGKRFGAFVLSVVLIYVTLGIGYVIWTLIIWGRGQNPAKQVLGMYVIDLETGRPATWGKMFIRGFVIDGLLNLVTFFIFWVVSAVMIWSNPENRRATDQMVSTIVVDAPRGWRSDEQFVRSR